MVTVGPLSDRLAILVVGADPLARGGLALLLAREPGVEIVAQVPPAEALAAAQTQSQPDVAVWDLGARPAADAGRLRDLEGTRIPVLALVPDEDAAADALAAGARGILFRDADPARIALAALAARDDMAVFDAGLVGSLVRPPAPALEGLVEALTPRELEVLQLLSLGLANKQIADRLVISEHTAKFHVNAILSKLGAQTRTEGVVRAARLGLIVL